MKVVIYEDNADYFYPLTNFFPQCYLRFGLGTIIDDFQHYFPKFRFDFIARDLFKFKITADHGPVMYLSSRFILKEKLPLPKEEVKFTVNSEVVGFLKVSNPYPRDNTEVAHAIKNIRKSKEINGLVLDNLCDLIKHSATKLTDDFKIHHAHLNHVGTGPARNRVVKRIEVIGRKQDFYVHKDAVVHDLVAVDVSSGPVFIDRGAIIRPFSMINGPTYIGEGSVVDRAKVTSSVIGPYCRIGGEVEACIFQGYSNKCHEGFLGHSFVGEWVNLGALTTNSDLKNNYSSVRVKIGEKVIDSGMVKLGCFIGDHSKLGIGTLIPTGAAIGSFVNFFGGGLMPRYLPSFKWLGPGVEEKYALDKAIETARMVMNRRGVKLTKEYENLIRANYKH
jgi:UDP-N-acetylglucosamine diphosphorylase/glucosamine-1-phosphate N-acetyltransferase